MGARGMKRLNQFDAPPGFLAVENKRVTCVECAMHSSFGCALTEIEGLSCCDGLRKDGVEVYFVRQPGVALPHIYRRSGRWYCSQQFKGFRRLGVPADDPKSAYAEFFAYWHPERNSDETV